MAYTVGETIKLKAVYTDSSGVAQDPSTPVTVSVLNPAGTKEVDAQNASSVTTGTWTFSFTPTTAGRHTYQFTTQDGHKESSQFYVRADALG